ncbi:hypothetical protein F4703DRAFT_1919980 [Phycomyces blakesleeanus]
MEYTNYQKKTKEQTGQCSSSEPYPSAKPIPPSGVCYTQPFQRPSVEWAANVRNIHSLLMSSGKSPFRMNPVYALPPKTCIPCDTTATVPDLACESRNVERHEEARIINALHYTTSLNNIPWPTRLETPTHELSLATYKHRDRVYQQNFNTQHKRHVEMASQKKRLIEHSLQIHHLRSKRRSLDVFNKGYENCANGSTGISCRIIFPQQKIRHRSKTFQFSINDIMRQADQQDILVPIRLDIEHDGYVLRDTFTWNMNETLITPCDFAQVMCEDMQLPVDLFKKDISRSISKQVNDYQLNGGLYEPLTKVTEILDSKQAVKNDRSFSFDTDIEWRVLIKLEIVVGNLELIDQFEWDLGCHYNSPEMFAEKLTTELSLGGEFRQIQILRKYCVTNNV